MLPRCLGRTGDAQVLARRVDLSEPEDVDLADELEWLTARLFRRPKQDRSGVLVDAARTIDPVT